MTEPISNQNNISRDEVIKELEAIRDYDPMIRVSHDDVFKKYAINALSLLEEQDRALKFQSAQLDDLYKEQKPVRPLIANDMYFCGSCKYAIPRTANYCPKCGKKVEWDD